MKSELSIILLIFSGGGFYRFISKISGVFYCNVLTTGDAEMNSEEH